MKPKKLITLVTIDLMLTASLVTRTDKAPPIKTYAADSIALIFDIFIAITPYSQSKKAVIRHPMMKMIQ